MSTLTSLILAHIRHPDLMRLASDPATSLSDLNYDGPARVGLAVDIEDEYGLVLLDEMHAWQTVGDVHDCVDHKLAKRRDTRRAAMDGLIFESGGDV
jgi:hypothetical protein